jgi:hypothetical protein
MARRQNVPRRRTVVASRNLIEVEGIEMSPPTGAPRNWPKGLSGPFPECQKEGRAGWSPYAGRFCECQSRRPPFVPRACPLEVGLFTGRLKRFDCRRVDGRVTQTRTATIVEINVNEACVHAFGGPSEYQTSRTSGRSQKEQNLGPILNGGPPRADIAASRVACTQGPLQRPLAGPRRSDLRRGEPKGFPPFTRLP